MFNFLLLMVVLNPLGGETAYILDYNLSETDCVVAMADWDQAPYNPNVHFECEIEANN